MLGGDAAGAVPSHRRAVELDPRSTICRVCAGVALAAAGREDEAAGQFEWLERQPSDDHLAAVAVRFRRGAGRRPGGRAVAAERGGARDGGVGRVLVVPDGRGLRAGGRGGPGAELAGRMRSTVRGWVDYVYFTRHDRFLESMRQTRRFQELMASARERYERFTDDGTPTVHT